MVYTLYMYLSMHDTPFVYSIDELVKHDQNGLLFGDGNDLSNQIQVWISIITQVEGKISWTRDQHTKAGKQTAAKKMCNKGSCLYLQIY